MNIIEALRTGKPIRRPIAKHWGSNQSGYLGNEYVLSLLTQPDYAWRYLGWAQTQLISESDLLADDWEVKEQV